MRLIFATLFAVLTCTGTQAAEPVLDPITEKFSAHDAESIARVDHSAWSNFLRRTILDAGRSKQRLGRGKSTKHVGSNTSYGNTAPSRFENNRLSFHLLEDEDVAFVRSYREGLEALPGRLPYASMSRNAQLAWWLNLYNATVVEQVAERYPLARLNKLRRDKGDDLWDEKLLEVDGVALSLRDIAQKILFPIWQDPLVLYGLWQGTIGGARLPTRAYTGDTVHDLLLGNAREFVNSNRGMLPKGKILRVSVLYRWGAPLFADESALIRHIRVLAEAPFSAGLDRVERVKYALYESRIADIVGGTTYSGPRSQIAGLANATLGGDSGFLSTEIANYSDMAIATDRTGQGLPPQAIDLIAGIRENNTRNFATRTTVEPCPSGEDCSPRTKTQKVPENP